MPKNKQHLLIASVGVFAAIAITATMDATGYTELSALPLFGLVVLFWVFQRFSTSEMGLKISSPKYYGIALLYPAIVMSIIAAIALAANAIDLSDANWSKTGRNIAAGSTIGVIMVLITEELFFRGWLWATLRRAGIDERQVLIFTSVVFLLWHISWVTLAPGFELPIAQVPVFLINVLLIGAIWGTMRMMSDSVLVPSVSHAVWNAFAYSLFGFGTRVGDLGIQQTSIYGPEVGWLGVALNLCFLIGLWTIYVGRIPAKHEISQSSGIDASSDPN